MNEHPQASQDQTYSRQRRAARARSVQFLYQVDAAKDLEMSTETFDLFWEQIQKEEADTVKDPVPPTRELTSRFVHGVIENLPELDREITASAKNWRVDRMSIIDRNILRLAAYELIFCDDIPPKASVNEAIELAKHYGDKDSPRFVNGVIDKLLRERPSSN